MAVLTARSQGAWVYVTGGDDGTQIHLYDHGWGDRRLSLNALGEIERFGDERWVRNIDATGMTVGLYSNWITDRPVVLRGSAFGDTFYLNSDRPEGWGGAAAYLRGWGGNDHLSGAGGNDTILGDWGNDRLWGGGGDDWLSGGSGRDGLDGGDGADVLDGGRGADTLDGGAGDDTLIASVGNDVIVGDEGNDVIVMAGARSDYDLYQVSPNTWIVTDLTGADGVDTIFSAETLRFTDGDYDLTDGGAGTLSASFADGRLVVQGAVRPGENAGVHIMGNDSFAVLEVWDTLAGQIDILGYEPYDTADRIDISGVTGAHENIITLDSVHWNKEVIGSDQTDRIEITVLTMAEIDVLSGGGDDFIDIGTYSLTSMHVESGSGNDRVVMGDGHAFVDLGSGNDYLESTVDVLASNFRNLHGGEGSDTLEVGASRSDVTVYRDGAEIVVSYPGLGTDTYARTTGFEYYSFRGELISVDDLLLA